MILNERRQLPPDGRYCVYLRKSRDEEHLEKMYGGDVLAKHIMLLDYAAEMNKHTIGHTYKEVKSGETIAARDEVRKLIEDVQGGRWDGVYVMAVDRLSRGSQQDQGIICDLLEITGLFIVTPSGYFDPWNPCDMDTIRYQLFASNSEFRSYSRRMQDSMRASVMGGQYMGRWVPFGYRKVKLENGFKTLEPTADAFYVKMMFCWAGYENRSLYWIAQELTRMGVKPPRGPEGKEWASSTVGDILSNEVYIAVSKWGKHKTVRNFTTDALARRKQRKLTDNYVSGEGKWEPIVDRELFELVKLQRARPDRVSPKREYANVCAHLMVCSKCGRAMCVRKDSYNGKIRVAHKAGYKCTQKGAEQKVVLEKLVEALENALGEVEAEAGGKKALADKKANERAIADINKKLTRLDAMSQELIEARLEMGLTQEEFSESRHRISENREKLKESLAEAEAGLRSARDIETLRATVGSACKMLLDDSVTGREKNMFLRGFIRKIEYTNDSDFGKNDKLELTVHFI